MCVCVCVCVWFTILVSPCDRPKDTAAPEEEVGGASSGMWYRFNDTMVEEFEMSEESMEAECFGGVYKSAASECSGMCVCVCVCVCVCEGVGVGVQVWVCRCVSASPCCLSRYASGHAHEVLECLHVVLRGSGSSASGAGQWGPPGAHHLH